MELSDPNGNLTVNTYDRIGRYLSETDAVGGTHLYRYNRLGMLESEKDSRGNETTYNYDAAGQLTQFTDLDGKVSYTYDENGNVTAITDENGRKLTRQYDKLNRVEMYTDENGQTISYKYDAAGRLTHLIYPDGKTVTYTYDADDQMTSVTDWKGRKSTYQYDANGRLIVTTRPDHSVETRTYDSLGQMTKLTDKKANGEIIHDYSYEYDAVGNLLIEEGGISPNLSDLNALGPSSDTLLEEGTGDESSFYFALNGPGLSPSMSDLENETKDSDTSMTYTGDNRLATYNDVEVQFDQDGNMVYGPLNGKMDSYVYDSRNRLLKAGEVQYGYNSENIRTSLTINGETTNFVINPHAILSQLLMETDEDGQAKAHYVYGLGLIGREDSSGNYQTYHFDRRGSTIALTDNSGQITDTYHYDPYGELLAHEGTTEQPFKYNGRDGVMTDPNGLYQMRARYYNPEIKRFINRDVVRGTIDTAQTLNRYAYVNGNPVTYIDPFGLSRDGDSKWLQGGNFLADMIPYIGTLKGFQQAFSGMNHVTGTKLSVAERWSEGIGSTMSFIPIPGMKFVGKYATEGLIKAGKKVYKGSEKPLLLKLDLQLFAKGTAKGKNVVYTSTNANDVVQYVGITNNYARRAAEHLRDKGINIQPLMKNLSRSDARAVEQALIEIHGLQKNGGTLMNRINSISSKNPSYAKQLARGNELLKSIGY